MRKTAQQLFDDAFSNHRDPRSDEYKAGVLALLQYRVDGESSPACPHILGTAQADAWFAGVDEGHSIVSAQPPSGSAQ